MQHSFVDQNVGINDPSGIDKDCAALLHGDLDVLAVEGGDALVFQIRAVHCAFEDVVFENLCEFLHGELGCCGTDGLESFVGRSEEGIVDGALELCGQTSLEGCSNKVL